MERKAVSVARDILRLARQRGEVMTQMKLIKLTYIAYGFYTALNDEKLFEDTIEAWQYGPVIPALYKYTRQYGQNAVPVPSDQELENPNLQRFLYNLLNVYLKYTALQLSNLTHRDDTPWMQTFKGYRAKISDDVIKAYYKGLNEQKKTAD